MSQATSSQHHSGISLRQISNKDGYGAIDLGSTSTRAYLTTVNKKTKQLNGYRVQKTGVDDAKMKRFLRGEWPSKGCPFDAPYPVGYDAVDKGHADKRDRSLKSFVWFLADEDDDHPYTRDLIDHYERLQWLKDKEEFRERLTDMLVRHLVIVAEQIRQQAERRQTDIRRLVFCVPNAWDAPNFQRVLRPIMDKVAEGVETYCVFESEALSQFILHQHPYLLTNYEFALVCDFGGHFMGGSLFQFCRDGADDEYPAFFSLPQGNFGVRGGSQLWEDHIRPYIDAHLATLGLPADMESVLRANFLDAFYIKKNEVDSTFYDRGMPMRLVGTITHVFPDDTTLYPLHLEPAQISRAWRLAFRASIDLALSKIQCVPVSARGRTVVIISGGSTQNYQARTEIQRACEKCGIECQAVGFDVNVESSKWMVCEGAALAEACAISPRDFFRRGAALAVQSYSRDGVYKTSADVLFSGAPGQLGQFDYDRGRTAEVELGVYAHSKIRLVCDPLYQQHRHRYLPNCISIHPDGDSAENNCYDVWDVIRFFEVTNARGTQSVVRRIPPGRYLLEVDGIDYHENEVDATLRLGMTRVVATAATQARAKRRLRARTASTVQDAYTFDLPLTSCGSSNLVLLDLDQVKKRFWKPKQARGFLPQAVPEPEPAADVRPAVNRQRAMDSSATELYDVIQGGAGVGPSVDSLGAPIQNMPSGAPARTSPTVTRNRMATATPYGRGGRQRLGGRRPLNSPAPPLRNACVHVSNVNRAHGPAEWDLDSDSDCSDIPDSWANLASFPVGTRK